jgi:hypothetical protein
MYFVSVYVIHYLNAVKLKIEFADLKEEHLARKSGK